MLGILAGSAMAQGLAPAWRLRWSRGFKISPLGIIVGAAMGLIVPVLAALLPVFNGTRVTILRCDDRSRYFRHLGKRLLARLIKVLPLPVTVRQALSNVTQKKGRLLLTVITLMLAASAFMGVFAMFTVVQSEIDKLFETFQYQITILPTEAQDYDTVSQLITQTGDIKKSCPASPRRSRFWTSTGQRSPSAPKAAKICRPSAMILQLRCWSSRTWKGTAGRR